MTFDAVFKRGEGQHDNFMSQWPYLWKVIRMVLLRTCGAGWIPPSCKHKWPLPERGESLLCCKGGLSSQSSSGRHAPARCQCRHGTGEPARRKEATDDTHIASDCVLQVAAYFFKKNVGGLANPLTAHYLQCGHRSGCYYSVLHTFYCGTVTSG